MLESIASIFTLPLFALIAGALFGAYFGVWWLRHRDDRHMRAVLCWAVSFFLMYWFQVPAILISLGKVITVTDFNLFFMLTFSMNLLSLVLIYLGILDISGTELSQKRRIILGGWFFTAIVFFFYLFILSEGIFRAHLLPLSGIAFYAVIRIVTIVTIIRLLMNGSIHNLVGKIGVGMIIGESVLGVLRNLFVASKMLTLPPSFWYLHIAQSQFFFSSQAASILLLALGFYFLHASYHRVR